MRRESGERRCERGERGEERDIEEDTEEEMKRRESSFDNAFLKPFCFAKAFTENISRKKRF
ncbi:MAG: hypothetical protein U9N61_01760 [Euryarchaeota archaeon]|nr:hypothetical protein [Euryarchaeota archaeon]